MKQQWLIQLNKLCSTHRFTAFLRDMVLVYLDRRISRSAAELAYYLMLSIFPMIILAVGIVSFMPLDAKDVLYLMKQIFPEQTAGMITNYVTYVLRHQGGGLFVAGLTSTMLTASAAFRGLVCISGEIYGRRAYRGVWHMVYSVVFSLLLIVMIYASLLAVLTGGWFIRVVEEYVPLSDLPDYWPVMRLLLLFSVSMVFLMQLYRATAPRTATPPPALVGALFTAALLTAVSSGFSGLISLSSRYSVVYGSMASMMILMLWLYICGNIVVLGNVFNYVWWRHRRGLGVAIILELKI